MAELWKVKPSPTNMHDYWTVCTTTWDFWIWGISVKHITAIMNAYFPFPQYNHDNSSLKCLIMILHYRQRLSLKIYWENFFFSRFLFIKRAKQFQNIWRIIWEEKKIGIGIKIFLLLDILANSQRNSFLDL